MASTSVNKEMICLRGNLPPIIVDVWHEPCQVTETYRKLGVRRDALHPVTGSSA